MTCGLLRDVREAGATSLDQPGPELPSSGIEVSKRRPAMTTNTCRSRRTSVIQLPLPLLPQPAKSPEVMGRSRMSGTLLAEHVADRAGAVVAACSVAAAVLVLVLVDAVGRCDRVLDGLGGRRGRDGLAVRPSAWPWRRRSLAAAAAGAYAAVGERLAGNREGERAGTKPGYAPRARSKVCWC